MTGVRYWEFRRKNFSSSARVSDSDSDTDSVTESDSVTVTDSTREELVGGLPTGPAALEQPHRSPHRGRRARKRARPRDRHLAR